MVLLDWASLTKSQLGGGNPSHRAGIFGIQRLLSVVCDLGNTATADVECAHHVVAEFSSGFAFPLVARPYSKIWTAYLDSAYAVSTR